MGKNIEMANDFITELKDLLKKHNAQIDFECSDGSDTHGIHDANLSIYVDRKRVAKVIGWSLDASELR